jgi:hypothetical protein
VRTRAAIGDLPTNGSHIFRAAPMPIAQGRSVRAWRDGVERGP